MLKNGTEHYTEDIQTRADKTCTVQQKVWKKLKKTKNWTVIHRAGIKA